MSAGSRSTSSRASPSYIPDYDTPRFRLTPQHFAYMKIAEGCNHPCSFCIIPQMRGRHRSRTIESVVAEARQLVKEGVREINLISQDTTFFGMDTWEQRPNPRTPGRFLARHRAHHAPAPAQRHRGRFLDPPALHAPGALERRTHRDDRRMPQGRALHRHAAAAHHPRMLELMRRETSSEHIENLIARIRAGIPGIAMRTTFIVGFPGETEDEFESLLDFIERTRFERLGVFTYSQEEGSRAAKMPDQIPAKVKQARFKKAMKLQQKIAREISESKVGEHLKVLVEKPLVARTEADAPDIDGQVILGRPAPVGEFVNVLITGTQVYDLIGELDAGS